ncbi:MAG: class I SAM-dependent RNA methyltransferase [Verrucomicrobia bacterium]|nr:class I SAM-dependent RNA methyltransferase [Verrucomicrobiota bacterium]
MSTNTILITCPKRGTAYLEEELKTLDYPVIKVVDAGVFTEGTLEDCWRLNLQIRTGLRILFQIAEFEAEDSEALYSEALKVKWNQWIADDGYVCVISSVLNPSIDNTQFARMKLKDAVVDQIRSVTGSRPDSGPDQNKTVLFLYWRESQVILYFDTSGRPLSNRGYRVHPWKAPVRETLAAAMISATRWDQNSHFVNPMCGSGTIAIEAALMALGRPPGFLRDNFGFMHLLPFDKAAYQKVRDSIPSATRKKLPFLIQASDLDPDAVEAARHNAKLAGVDHVIQFSVSDFRDLDLPDAPGVVVMNPEYGERLGAEKELVSFYREIGDFFKKKAAGYWAYVFTGNPGLGKRIGLRTTRRIEFYNGPIDCRLMEFELYSGTKRTSFRPED